MNEDNFELATDIASRGLDLPATERVVPTREDVKTGQSIQWRHGTGWTDHVVHRMLMDVTRVTIKSDRPDIKTVINFQLPVDVHFLSLGEPAMCAFRIFRGLLGVGNSVWDVWVAS